ncbi:hypothetical protein [Microbacterium sp. JB110]|uniref:hypothetical protein n=1 Tax=Microbacterium sp. JB110 TaxID=2024477 RepID=UPI00097F2C45|nr:hypothetical protein [Microbacterium sp. JB110]SJM46760.1 hypothetical protein CZ774_02865 [Frigoribacterium sp. JB110]
MWLLLGALVFTGTVVGGLALLVVIGGARARRHRPRPGHAGQGVSRTAAPTSP